MSKASFLKTTMKSESDPVYFANEVLGIELFAKQEEILREFYGFKYKKTEPEYGELVLCAGMRCISEDSMILTETGYKKAKDITIHDRIWNGYYFGDIHRTYLPKIKYANKIETNNGNVLICSPEHQILTVDGWKKSSKLTTDDILYNSTPEKTVEINIEKIYPIDKCRMVDFTMCDINQYTCNDIIVHNSGKTALFGVIGAYEMFEVISKPDPAKYYGLMPNQLVSLACAAASEKQGTDGIFNNIKTNLRNCDFINDNWNLEYYVDSIKCHEKNTIFRILSSNTNTAVGRSHKAVLYDELDLFEQTEGGSDGAWNFYNRVNKSTVTFKKHGFSFATSSPIHANGIILTLVERANELDKFGNRLRPRTLAYKIPTWEFNPELTKEELMLPYKHDMETFWKDFGCDPSAASSLQFPLGVTLNNKLDNILSDFRDVPVQSIPHVMAIDPALKSDSFGVAVGYYNPYADKVIIDGVTSIVPERGSILSASEIRFILEGIIRRCNVVAVMFDTYMFPEMLEYFQYNMGQEVIKNIVNKEDYDRLREYMESGRIDICFNEYLKIEMEKLVIKKLSNSYKVDHPAKGSKDMADCVANVLHYMSEIGLVGGQSLPYFGLGGMR
jgi:hypothetical protein